MTIPDPSKLYPRAKDRQTIDALLELRWWDWPLEKLSKKSPVYSAGGPGGFAAKALNIPERKRTPALCKQQRGGFHV
ncbi:MAG: hypothetical protein HFG05_04730 [Oscillibacter sp.]|nr:hypothetical protein [Oscillibacter sp.]